MSWKEKLPLEKMKRLLPVAFLIYGLVSVFTLQRDFSHVTQLSIFVLLVGPAFVTFALLTRFLENVSDEHRFSRYRNVFRRANLSATQTLTQYILIFCLPFYVIKANWIYFGINVLWLATILWDPIYERLIQSTLYRHMLLAWALISASSFLFPFVLPGYITYFYPGLAGISALAFFPTRREGKYVLLLFLLWGFYLVPLLFVPPAFRFPLLSVWAKKPHFAWDVQGKPPGDAALAKTMSKGYFRDFLQEGHALCCVAPVVAPPKLSTNIRQEWTLGDKIIESTELKTRIQGNIAQQAFHSYFCKRNFPLSGQEEKLKCRVTISDDIDIGGTLIEITP